MNDNRITAVLFTFSWGGFCVRLADGSQLTLSPRELLERVGEREYDRLNHIAHRLPGHWQAVPSQAEGQS
jgi:hypothetical protein